MTYTAATARMERLTREVQAAAERLNRIDAEALVRIGKNLRAFEDGDLAGWEAAGVLSVNVDELITMIERLTRP